MEETTDKTKTIVFNALRVTPEDHARLTAFLAPYNPKREGVTALLNKAEQEPGEPIIKEVHQNFEQLFEYNSYAPFIQQGDTDILEAIKRGLEFANNMHGTINKTQTETTPANVLNFVPTDLIDKVNLLHRDLKMKNKIPAESTQDEYLKNLLTYALKYFLLNEYPKIYNR